jgi:hypothetical protein
MSNALATFKRTHGVATHRKAGAGHRYPWMAFFSTITLRDGTRRAFTELAHEYSMLKLRRRDKVADADTELEAASYSLNAIASLGQPTNPNAKQNHEHTHR